MKARSNESLLLVIVFGMLTLLPCSASGQAEDPFADASEPAPVQSAPVSRTPAVLDQGDPELQIPTDPTARAIVQSRPQTAEEFVRVIDMLLDLERADLAAPFVDQATAMTVSDREFYQLYRNVGVDVVVRLGLVPDLGENGTALSQRIIDGARRYVAGEEYLPGIVERVLSDDTYDRSRALYDLKLLGDVGAAALIELLVQNSYERSWPRIRAALKEFGAAAEGPLLAAWNSNSAKLRAEALQALAFVNTSSSIETLMGPAHAAPEGSLNRQLARRSLTRLTGRASSADECCQVLYQSARDYLLGYTAASTDKRDTRWWHWNPESRTLVPVWLTGETVSRIRGYRRARDLVGIRPDRADYRRLYWVTRLESAKMTAGTGMPLPATVRDELALQIEPAFLNTVLDEALRLRRVNAAIAACEMLAESGDASLLDASESAASPLVRALGAGSVELTSAAAHAISQIAPAGSFVGCSDYLDALFYLGRSTGLRSAIVGHIKRDTAVTLAAQAGQSGYHGIPVGSATEMLQEAHANPDVQLIMLSDAIGEPGYSEVLQALRAQPRTRLVPVLLLVSSDEYEAAATLAQRYPNVMATPMIHDAALLARQIDNLVTMSYWHHSGNAQRAAFGRQALGLLAMLGENPGQYPYADLMRYEDDMARLVAFPASAFESCRLLGAIGTPDAQVTLINTASNGQLPEALRRDAAESFERAVRRRGLLLDRETILNQYDRYNRSEQESAEVQAILGSILDTIEGKRSSDDS